MEQEMKEALKQVSLKHAEIFGKDAVAAVEAANEAAPASEDGTPTGTDIKALKIELRANNFYRGNPYIEQVGSLLGFTSEELDYLFENKELPREN